MLEKSLGLLFYLKKPKNYRKGAVPIYLRITVDGAEKEVSTKRAWEPAKWNAKANRASGTKEDCKSLNEYLDILQNQTYEARKQLIERGKPVTAAGIRDILSGAEQRKWELLALFKKHNDELKAMIGKGAAKGTWINFSTSYTHTADFLKVQYGLDEINILALDLDFVKKMYHWFRTVKNCCHNTTLKNIANLKKIVLMCVDNGWLVVDPFAKFDLTREDVETTYLTKEELQAIAEKDFYNKRLERVRDVFVFCCFTGLAFIDVKQLKRSEITLGADGELRVCKGRQKTGTASVIPLLPITQTILAKYQHDPVCVTNDIILPVLSNQKYNAYLKEIAGLCNIEKELKSHVARHTFGTSVTLANNVPMETVSKMMGHKNLRQTQHYAKVLAIKVNEDMALLKKRLAKSNFIATYQ
jgi:integrase